MTTSTLRRELARDERKDTTHDLFLRAAEATGPERERLLEEVVVANLGVARSVAKRYAGRGVPLEDLEQVAYLALVKAAHRFDSSRGEDFLPYAVPTMTGEIRRWFRDQGWTVRPPRSLQELQGAVLAARAAADRDLKPTELADQLGVPEARVREALQINGCFTASSLDAPLRGHADSTVTLGDTLVSGHDDIETCQTRLAVEAALATLPERERLIARLRYAESLTQAEIGEAVGVTQTQVSRILSKVRATLQEQLADVAA